MPTQQLDIPRSLRRGGRLDDVETSVDYTLKIIDLVCNRLGHASLADTNVLDMGCGWRMAKTLLEQDIPIAQYAGIDVFTETIEFLQSNVNDERFSFHSMDVHNAMYNPQGSPLSEAEPPPLPESNFDIIWLFSVFTHLAPADYSVMLKLLRPYVKPNGKLIFSLFVNEITSNGLGFATAISKSWAKNPEKHSEAFADKFDQKDAAQQETPDFIDFDPKRPLQWAMYSRKHALELVEGTGWKVESLNEPEGFIQHYMICTPE